MAGFLTIITRLWVAGELIMLVGTCLRLLWEVAKQVWKWLMALLGWAGQVKDALVLVEAWFSWALKWLLALM